LFLSRTLAIAKWSGYTTERYNACTPTVLAKFKVQLGSWVAKYRLLSQILNTLRNKHLRGLKLQTVTDVITAFTLDFL